MITAAASLRRMLARMVRAAQFRTYVEYGQIDLGGES